MACFGEHFWLQVIKTISCALNSKTSTAPTGGDDCPCLHVPDHRHLHSVGLFYVCLPGFRKRCSVLGVEEDVVLEL